MLNNLIRKACNLDISEKQYLLNNFENIISIIDKNEKTDPIKSIAKGEHPLFVLQKNEAKNLNRKKKLIIHQIPADEEPEQAPVSHNLVSKPTASTKNILTAEYLSGNMNSSLEKIAKVYDPETPEQMLKVIDLIERFLKIDNDLSCESMGIFLYPLSRGAKRLSLRPFRVVGLTNNLWSLCRKHDSCLTPKDKSLNLEEGKVEATVQQETPASIRKIFKNKLAKIKTRLNNKDKKIQIHPSKRNSVVFKTDQIQNAQNSTEDEERISNVKKSIASLKDQGMDKDSILNISKVFSISKEKIGNMIGEIYTI